MDAAIQIISAFGAALAAIAALIAVMVAVAEAKRSRGERRLERVAAAIRQVEDLLGQILQSSQAAMVRFAPALAEVGAAAQATGLRLDACGTLAAAGLHADDEPDRLCPQRA